MIRCLSILTRRPSPGAIQPIVARAIKALKAWLEWGGATRKFCKTDAAISDNFTWSAYLSNDFCNLIMHPYLIEFIGYLASAASVLVFFSKTMAPLRIAAVVANGLFASYFALKSIYPMAALNLLMMPINMIRLRQVSRLIDNIRKASGEASNQNFNYSWLEEYASAVSLSAGDCLYQKADMAEVAYVLLEGEVRLLEADITLSPVALFGEMGLFTQNSRRTMTAVAKTKVELLSINYNDIVQIASENPTFSFYLMHLMVRRMMQNIDLIKSKKKAREIMSTPQRG